ncbi:MAG TPA: glycosyltransferase family 4 protein [Aliidongia sp.]|uniref:glycosyltransferase family 4 protein n=1 Tax=Aliidongia sp. TaxID=1914230 RepID=UPI002DDD8B4D|nr:glycosyltransferase family 4 protein [Aliidongia sp.]HEV2674609.1 glycosyltransferase family 4 protein [Aliidongia sp.]
MRGTGSRDQPIDIEIPVIALSQHGGTRILVEFANYAATAGYSVRISLPKGRIGKKYEFHPDLDISEIRFPLDNKYLNYFLFLILAPFFMRGRVLIANFFVTLFPVLLTKHIFGKNYLYFVQDIESKYSGIFGKVLNALCEWSYRSRFIVAANTYLAKELAVRRRAVFSQINLGVSRSFLEFESRVGGKEFDLIVFPRHEPWKGLDRLVRVLDLYRQRYGAIKILAVGQNPESLARLQAMGFTCERPADEHALIRAFDRARATLFTSHREGFGLPPLEGMARGLPAIVFECGGPSAYMLNGSNGFVIERNDESAAVERIRQLLLDDELARTMSENARETAARHTSEAAFGALLALAVEQAGVRPDH